MNLNLTQLQAEVRERFVHRHRKHLKDAANVGVIHSPSSVGKTADPRIISIIATTDDIDLQGEVVVPGGADWSYFEQNQNIFADHQTDIFHGVAVLRSLTPIMSKGAGPRRQTGWKVNACLRNNDLGNDMGRMIEEGGMGASIGFLSEEAGKPTDDEVRMYKQGSCEPDYIHRRWKGMEVSCTLLACNVPCRVSLSTEQKAVATDGLEMCERLLSKGLIRKSSAIAFGFPAKQSTPVRIKWQKLA